MDAVEYTLENEHTEAEAPADDFFSAIPDHVLAGKRRQFIDDILHGAKPEHAAIVHSLQDYDSDPALAEMVNRAESESKVRAQKALYEMAVTGRQVPAALWYWLEARCGYDRKTDDNSLPQTVNVERKVLG